MSFYVRLSFYPIGRWAVWLKFCTKCGSFLTVIEKDGKRTLGCPKCNLSSDVGKNIKVMKKNIDSIITIGKNEANIDIQPKTIIDCEKCGNKEAYYWQVQTRSSDEPMTRFYRCTKCGSTWREYSWKDRIHLFLCMSVLNVLYHILGLVFWARTGAS